MIVISVLGYLLQLLMLFAIRLGQPHLIVCSPHLTVCGMRQLPPATTLKLAEIAWRYAHKGVVAFDLAGPEDGFSSEKHKVRDV